MWYLHINNKPELDENFNLVPYRTKALATACAEFMFYSLRKYKTKSGNLAYTWDQFKVVKL